MNAKRSVAAFLAAALLAGAAGADAPAPNAKAEDDKVVLENAHVSVWFHGKKPMMKIFPVGSEKDGYSFKYTRVVEFRDADGDGLADPDEVRAFLDLASAKAWLVETTTDASSATVRLTLSAPLKLVGPGRTDLEIPLDDVRGNVTLVFRVHGVEVPIPEANLTLRTTEVKADFLVNEWTWLDAGADRLALLGETPERATLAGPAAATLAANGTLRGGLAWAPVASAKTGEAESEVAVVTAIDADGGSRIQHAFNASGFDALTYDPVFGVPAAASTDDPGTGTPSTIRGSPGAGFAIAAVAAAAVAAFRRR